MIVSRLLPFALTPLLTGCFGLFGGDDTAPDDACGCGDIDGPGTETGDVPDVLGDWSSIFGTQVFDEDCGVEDLDQTSETWINGAAFHVAGYVPDGLYGWFGTDDDERFQGIMSEYGGINFSGRHDHSQGTMHVSFGGLVYSDSYRQRDVIEGFAYLGMDLNEDGEIECAARGQWQAMKSSSYDP